MTGQWRGILSLSATVTRLKEKLTKVIKLGNHLIFFPAASPMKRNNIMKKLALNAKVSLFK